MNRLLIQDYACHSRHAQVVFTEEMEEDPLKTLGEVLSFLGLDMVDPEGKEVRPENDATICPSCRS